jgi:hypothetical protein
MDKNGIGYEDARDLMKAKRKLVKLELRHQVMLDQWRSGKW